MKTAGNGFYALMISLLATAVIVVYIVSIYDRGLALGLGFAFFVVVALFLQQFISSEQLKTLLGNFVNYENAKTTVKEKEAAIQSEGMRAMRQLAQTNNTLAVLDAQQIAKHANNIAGLLADAEREKIKGQLMGFGGGADDEEFTL